MLCQRCKMAAASVNATIKAGKKAGWYCPDCAYKLGLTFTNNYEDEDVD